MFVARCHLLSGALFTHVFTQAGFSKLKNARKPCVLLFCSTAVRFTPESRHVQCTTQCLLWANSGHGGPHKLPASFQTPYPCTCQGKGANATRIWHKFPNVSGCNQAIPVFVRNCTPHRSDAHFFQGLKFLVGKWDESAFGYAGKSRSYSCHGIYAFVRNNCRDLKGSANKRV